MKLPETYSSNIYFEMVWTIAVHPVDFSLICWLTSSPYINLYISNTHISLLDVILTNCKRGFVSSGSFDTGLSDCDEGYHLIVGLLFYRNFKTFVEEDFRSDPQRAESPFPII